MRKLLALLVLCLFSLPQMASAGQFSAEELKESVAAVLRSDRSLMHYKYINDYDIFDKKKNKPNGEKKIPIVAYNVDEYTLGKGNGYTLLIHNMENSVLAARVEKSLRGMPYPKRWTVTVKRPDGIFTYFYERDMKPQDIRRCPPSEAEAYQMIVDNHDNMIRDNLSCVIDSSERAANAAMQAASSEDIFENNGSAASAANEYAGSGTEIYGGKEYQYLEYRTPQTASVAWTKRLYFDDGKLVRLVIRRNSAETTVADTLKPFDKDTMCLSGVVIYEIYKFTTEVDDYTLNPLGSRQI